MIRKITGTIISVFFLLNFAFASEIPIYEVGKKNLQLNDFTVGFVVDSGQLNIDRLAQIEDFQLISSRFTFTSLENNYWFVFKMTNSTSESLKRFVGFDEVYMETADLYYQTDKGWHHEQNGLSQPMGLREIKNRCPVFCVSLNSGETKTVYLKLHSKFDGVVGVFIEDIPEFVIKEQTKIMGYWGYFGAALAILLYNLFLLYHIRERIYLYYVINAICIIIFTLLYSGFSLYINSSVYLFYALHTSSAVLGIFISLFTRELLMLQNQNKWIDRILNVIIGIYAILFILILINIEFYRLLVYFTLPSMLFLLFIGIYHLTKKTPLTHFYIIAMSGYLLGLFMIAAVSVGLIPFNMLTRYGFLIGSLIELIVFSLALAYRVKLLQEEKETYQDKILATEKSIKKKLETQVQLRTRDLIQITEELQESNATKDKFFSIIAHDLKSPFNAMIGFSKLLRDNFADFTLPEQKEYINYIYHAVQNTHKLLDNLLLWSRSQKGVVEFRPEKLKLNALSFETIEFLSEVAVDKSINIKDDIQDNIYVRADSNMLSTILRNLVSNAIKFTPKGGEIIINARSLSYENRQKDIEISVKDKGIGIAEGIQSKLFSIGESSLARGTENESGTGLGLVLCKEFVGKHGGEIRFESKIGRGSTFYFTIPASVESTQREMVESP